MSDTTKLNSTYMRFEVLRGILELILERYWILREKLFKNHLLFYFDNFIKKQVDSEKVIFLKTTTFYYVSYCLLA